MSLGAKLNRRVTLQERSTTRDEFGGVVPGWSDVATVWAGIVDVSGREYVAAGATQNSAITKITIRYREGVTPAMRVLHGEDEYSIEAVLGQDRRTLLLMCSRAG